MAGQGQRTGKGGGQQEGLESHEGEVLVQKVFVHCTMDCIAPGANEFLVV